MSAATPLEEELKARIRKTGPLPFVEYMRSVLYHPEHGYYTRLAPGAGAGYVTAPSLSPRFGACLSRALTEMWQALGSPGTFAVCEPGPGSGDLAASVQEHAAAGLREALRWVLIEPHPRLEEAQRRRLDGLSVDWARSLRGLQAGVGCVLANEVLDALPVHLLRVEGGVLLEGDVAVEGEQLVLRFGRAASPELKAYVEQHGGKLEDGWQLEVCLEAIEWVRDAAAALARGYLMVIDYGDTAPALYQSRPQGSLSVYGPGWPEVGPLDRPGELDLTAHVNFTALRLAAEAQGLGHVTLTTQRDLLLNFGLREDLDRLREEAWAATGAESLRLHSARSAGAALARRGGMGDFRVLVMAKDAPDPPQIAALGAV